MFVARLLRRFTTLTWGKPPALIVAVFVASWALMTVAEPDSALVRPENYWWWFIVTASTVGYGDFYPQSTAGHLVGLFVIGGGIASLTTLFARMATAIDTAKGRRMAGTATLNSTGHTVIIGYTPGRSDRLINDVLADNSSRELVLCGQPQVPSHPLAHLNVAFVRGELSNEDTVFRAGVHRAAHVLIDADDDNEALAILVTVTHLGAPPHIVAALHDISRAQQLSYVHDKVQCVQWHHPRMLAEELQDPGITRIYSELMSPAGRNTYSITLPPAMDHLTAGQCQVLLGQDHSATLLGYDHQGELHVSPPWPQPIPAGSTIYYVGAHRLTHTDLMR